MYIETEISGAPEPLAAPEVKVHQGYLETSNTNAIEEMTGMINALRAYEANQKALTTQDDALGKAANEVGRMHA